MCACVFVPQTYTVWGIAVAVDKHKNTQNTNRQIHLIEQGHGPLFGQFFFLYFFLLYKYNNKTTKRCHTALQSSDATG